MWGLVLVLTKTKEGKAGGYAAHLDLAALNANQRTRAPIASTKPPYSPPLTQRTHTHKQDGPKNALGAPTPPQPGRPKERLGHVQSPPSLPPFAPAKLPPWPRRLPPVPLPKPRRTSPSTPSSPRTNDTRTPAPAVTRKPPTTTTEYKTRTAAGTTARGRWCPRRHTTTTSGTPPWRIAGQPSGKKTPRTLRSGPTTPCRRPRSCAAAASRSSSRA